MDPERLIQLVRDRPELYDPHLPKHRDRDFITAMWTEVATELGLTYADVKSKWQILRSNYMREKRKLKKLPASQAHKIVWQYFESLRFLNCLEPSENSTYEEDKFSNEGFNSDSSKQNSGGKIFPEIPGKRMIIDETDETYFNHSNKLITNKCSEDDEDPDMLFLRSLLPFIKQLAPLQNLEFRGDLINLLKQKLQSTQCDNCNYTILESAPGPCSKVTALYRSDSYPNSPAND